MSDPVEVYPNTFTRQQPPSHSNGSFGTVFVVLAVITVVSAIACILGRLCSRRHRPSKPKQNKNQNQNQNENHAFRRKEWAPRQTHNFNPAEGGDIELGFEKRIPTAKVAATGGEAKGFSRPPGHGEFKGQVRFTDGPELRFGP